MDSQLLDASLLDSLTAQDFVLDVVERLEALSNRSCTLKEEAEALSIEAEGIQEESEALKALLENVVELKIEL